MTEEEKMEASLYLPTASTLVPERVDCGLVKMLFNALTRQPHGEQSGELSGGMGASNNPHLGEVMTLLFRAERMRDLLHQLDVALFVDVEGDGQGVLAGTRDGTGYAFRFREASNESRFSWTFARIEVPYP